MNVSAIRLRFRDYTGEERFRRFVRTVNGLCLRDRRLRFWQQKLLDEFGIATGCTIDPDEVFSVFGVCDVHETDLLEAHSGHALLEIRDTYEFDVASAELFPFATDGLVCADCYDAYREWVAANDALCRILRCQTTYAAFCARWLKDVPDFLAEVQHEIDRREAEISAEMEPGDEVVGVDSAVRVVDVVGRFGGLLRSTLSVTHCLVTCGSIPDRES